MDEREMLQKSRHNISIFRLTVQFEALGGGANTHIIELSKKMDPYLERQVVVAPETSKSNDTIFDEKFNFPVIRVSSFRLKKKFHIPVLPLNHLFYFIKVFKIMRQNQKPDLIHAHGITATAYGRIIGKLLGIPVVGMIHGSNEVYRTISGFHDVLLATLIKPNHALILDDGSPTLQKFSTIWKDRTTPVYHGIDTDLFQNSERDTGLMEQLSLNPLDFIILSTNSLIPVKNVDFAIKAFSIFSRKTGEKNVKLVILGDGSLKNELIELAEQLHILDKTLFLGRVKNDEIPKYLSLADIVVGPSLYSNLNRSIQEAMACQIPVVVFDSGRTGELIKDIDNGLLISRGEIDSFADALEVLYRDRDLREQIGKNARLTIMSQRNWDARIKTELEVYHRILGR